MKSYSLSLVVLTAIIIAATVLTSCSDDDKGTTSAATVPEVTTLSVSAITASSAQCGGEIVSDGGAPIVASGVCWSTDPDPSIADASTLDTPSGGSFTSHLSGLGERTTYHVRAYAINSEGTGYGEVRTFSTEAVTVTDIDGNTYQTVVIGDQRWMAENLKVTHYRNGEAIPHVTDIDTWDALTTGAYCAYNKNEDNVATYGRLYNWYAVDDSRNIAPEGWHVPTDEDWKQLEMYLGMSQATADSINWRGYDEGGKLKETGTTHWASPNTGATDESDFTALPGGYLRALDIGGYFMGIGQYAYFWSSTEHSSIFAWSRSLFYDYSQVSRFEESKHDGVSVRCVKD